MTNEVSKTAASDQALEKLWGEVLDVDAGLEKINDELIAEEAKLAAKYEQKKQPLYAQRQKLFSQIPRFWATVIENHPVLCNLVQMDEMDLLALLTSLDIERDEANPSSFKVHLRFQPNDYLPSTIAWKAGKDLSKPSDGEDSSFFHWFASNESSIGELLATDLFPNAVRYFQDEVEDDDEEAGHSGEEELLSEDDEDDDEDDDDEDADQEHEAAPLKKRVKSE
ncbi:hypothetical protein BJ085DRAFT_17725 [Dimargaris cristalligena]|uniref:Nucleosome assembly protein n=1 Tax=Dimargaris cristalligena TaxID=215637 RepID=A0A4P9ZQR0_9FUNG|nr:hypothetical protein BJ085DRAFT_17725 [Dimargaris cristalligena]|eukprot:RKP35071.1 hypothetical protein BJ085DRAFT_17725 [Dimargaris cristalligena]